MPKLTCAYDHKPFEAARATAKYCSEACKQAAKREKRSGKPKVVKREELMFDTTAPADVQEAQRDLHAAALEQNGVPVEEKNKSVAEPTIPSIPTRVRKSRDQLIAEMNARLEAKGLPPIQTELPPISFVRTGYEEIDQLTAAYDKDEWGGFPRKHITEVFGTKGAGKTSLMKQLVNFNTFALAEMGEDPLSVLYIDAENGMINPPPSVIVTNNPLLEHVEEMVCRAVETDDYDLIVIDSVAMLSSQREMEGTNQAMMEKAKAMGMFVRRLNAFLRVHGDSGKHKDSPGTAIVFVNQLRDTGNSFGVKEFTPGGHALEYGASLRLELRSAKADKVVKDGRSVGQRVRVKVEKSRFNGGDVGTTVIFKLMFGEL